MLFTYGSAEVMRRLSIWELLYPGAPGASRTARSGEGHKHNASRLKKLNAHSYRDLVTDMNLFQLSLADVEQALRGIELSTDGMGGAPGRFQRVRFRLVDDPCLSRVHEQPPQAMPDALGVIALAVFPRSDQRPFPNPAGAFVETLGHRSRSIPSSSASRSATSNRWGVGSGICTRGSRSDSVATPDRAA